MKTIGFGQWTGAGFTAIREAAPSDCAYMAMSDYLLLTADLSEGGTEEAEAWVAKNLPRFFPDEPDRHPFDLLPRSPGCGHCRQVLFTSAECLAEYRKAFPSVPLASLLSAFRDPDPSLLGPERDFARVVAMPGWIEWASRSCGIWTLGQRVEAPASFRAALALILSDLADRPDPLPVQLIFHPDAQGDLGELPELVDAIPFDKAFDRGLAARRSHFDRETKNARARVRAMAAIIPAALLLISLNAYFIASAASFRRERKENLALVKELKAADTRERALLAERDQLLAASGPPGSVPSAASLVAALSRGLGSGARLSEIAIEDGNFTATAISANALFALEALEAVGGFEGLKISGIASSAEGERFTLTGSYREKL